MPYARIATNNGVVVPLTNETAGNAVKAANFVADGNDLVLDLNPMYSSQEPGAYPLLLATYEIVCSKGSDPDTSGAIKSFLTVAAGRGRRIFPRRATFRCPTRSKTGWLPRSRRCSDQVGTLRELRPPKDRLA